MPSRTLPDPVIAVGAETGAPPTVRAFAAETGAELFARTVYEPGFTGGVRVATADFTGDMFPDLAVGPGPGGGPRVRVLDGKTGDPIPGPLGDLWAFEPGFTGGVQVAAADVDADGTPDLLAAAGTGGGPRVRAFSGRTGRPLADLLAFDPAFRGGMSVAAADFTRDGRAELVVGAGPGGGPRVRVFDLTTGRPVPGPLGSFFAFEPAFRGGVSVGTDWKAGDVDLDGVPDLAVGAGPGRAPDVRLYSGATGRLLRTIAAFDPGMTAGVRVAVAQISDDPRGDVVVATGPGVPGEVRTFDGPTGRRLTGPAGSLTPFGPGFRGGLALAAGNDPPDCCGEDLPFDETFPWTDGFDSGDGGIYNTADVREQITSDPATGEMTWTFTVTNTSVNDQNRDQDLSDIGLGYFAFPVPDLGDITEVASDWPLVTEPNGAGPDGVLAWAGPPIPVGASVTLGFRTPDVPAVCGSGMVFHRAVGPETSAAGGFLAVPGKLTIDVVPAEGVQDVTKDLTITYRLNGAEIGWYKYTGVKEITVTDNAGAEKYRLQFAQRVEASLSRCLLKHIKSQSVPDNVVPPGYDSTKYDKGHLLADEFGGWGDLRNIVSMERVSNQSGAYRAQERAIRAKLDATATDRDRVVVRFVPKYDPATAALFGKKVKEANLPAKAKLRPTSIDVTIDGTTTNVPNP